MQRMHLATFEKDGHDRPGAVQGDAVIDLSARGYKTLLDFIEAGPEALAEAEKMVNGSKVSSFSLSSVRLRAPIPKPRKLICVGLNYRDHAAETGSEIPSVPTIFNKFATAVIGPGDNVVLPKVSKAPDYEAEFAFVVGKGGRHIKAEDWTKHIFG